MMQDTSEEKRKMSQHKEVKNKTWTKVKCELIKHEKDKPRNIKKKNKKPEV